MDDFAAESYRILVIDDSRSFLRIVGSALASDGYEVMMVESGEEALELRGNLACLKHRCAGCAPSVVSEASS